jgi:DNA polymerase-1
MANYQRTFAGFDDESDSPATAPENRQSEGDSTSSPLRLDGETVYIVDSHSLIYQVFHALPEMTGPAGQPVGAILGFIRDLMALIETKRPNYLFCAFDTAGGGRVRHELYEQYKANRAAMPEDLRPQIPNIQRLLSAMGIPILQSENFEADDVLATLARRTEQAGGACFLVTSDKDCRQLLSERVLLYNIRKDQIYNAQALLNDWGIRPEQVIDFQSLVGDAVDNIPGVPLIGPKLARELLTEYETLEAVLDNAQKVAGKKRRENLIQYREQAMLSRQLVRLFDDLPIEVDWEAGRVGGVDSEQAIELCREFGLRQLEDQFSSLTVQAAPVVWEANYRVIETFEALERLVTNLKAARRIAVDTETTSPHPRWAELVGMSFAWAEGEAAYLPFRSPSGEPQLELEKALDLLRPLLEDSQVEKVGQNIKYDLIVLRGVGVELRGITFDTMVADYLLDPGERNHGLDDLASRYLNHKTTKIEELIGTGKRQKRMDAIPVQEVGEYACEDADVPFRLALILQQKLEAEGLHRLFHELEMPLVHVLAEMEFHGVKVDSDLLERLGARIRVRLADLEQEIHTLAGSSFNIESPRQLAKILFEQLDLPVTKRTKTGPSTDVQVLVDLAKLHPLPAKIIDYRQGAKLKSTYADALPTLVHPETGRVHTSFKQEVAATGRLSSTEPNLQNIPVRTAEGREIRAAFLPSEAGWKLLTADYSQIELRVLAHYSEDEALRRAFANDLDIHTEVASEVFGLPLAEVTTDMRRRAKAVNFGVIYGQSPFGLATALDIPKDEAAEFIDSYFARYPGVEKFMQKVLEECRGNGYVSTVLGRRRAVQGVRDPSRAGNSRLRNLPERIAINTVIQGSAADLIKQAMINVSERIQSQRPRGLQARMLLQIHDELVFEVPSNEIDTLAALVEEEMTAVGQMCVPLTVDIKVGNNWADCEAL